MKLIHDNETYHITHKGESTIAIKPLGVDRVKVYTEHPNGEITLITQRVGWLNRTLKSLEVVK